MTLTATGVTLTRKQFSREHTRGPIKFRQHREALHAPLVSPASHFFALRSATMIRALVVLSFAVLAVKANVLEFTDSNFKSEIQDHNVILVEFYAPW